MVFGRFLKTAAALCFGLSVNAAVLRGPYLQRASHSEITVCWRTDTVCAGSVLYGTSASNMTFTTTEPASGTNHAVRLTGLAPDTTYYYQINCGTNGFSEGGLFETFPEPGSANRVRIWVLGDSGKGDANAASVYNAFLAYNRDQYTDLMLMLGDNAYYSGTDAEYQSAVFDMYPEILRQTPWFSCYGNHDGYRRLKGETTQSKARPQPGQASHPCHGLQ